LGRGSGQSGWVGRVVRAGRGSRARDAGRRLAAVLLAAAAACGLVACGGAAAAGRPSYDIRVTAIRGLGRVLTDGSGYTLYMYVPDHRGRSVCYHACASQWPPLLLPPGVRYAQAGPGVRAALLGTTTRVGGSLQVTYGKWPLYRYVSDIRPGQATGQAENMGLWYVLSPDGSVDRHPLPGSAGN